MAGSHTIPDLIAQSTLKENTQIKIFITERVIETKNTIRRRITDNRTVQIINFTVSIHINKPHITGRGVFIRVVRRFVRCTIFHYRPGEHFIKCLVYSSQFVAIERVYRLSFPNKAYTVQNFRTANRDNFIMVEAHIKIGLPLKLSYKVLCIDGKFKTPIQYLTYIYRWPICLFQGSTTCLGNRFFS